MTNIPENIIDKIKKLFALSESPNENEALVAMEKAHSMLAQYNLSMQDINTVKFNVEQEMIGCGKYSTWELLLANAIVDYNFCTLITDTMNHITKIYIIGKSINIIATKNFLDYIFETIERLVQSNYGSGRKYLESYKTGIAAILIDRIAKLKYADMKSDCKDLVVTEKQDNDAFLKNKYGDNLTAHKVKAKNVEAEAYNHGIQDGKNISFNEQIKNKETVGYLV